MRPAHARQTQQSIFIDGRSIGGVRQLLSWNTSYVSHLGDSQAVLLDTITYSPDTDMPIVTTYVHHLASMLATADPNVFGLLACHGVVKVANEQAGVFQLQIVFAILPGLFISRTLRDLLLEGAIYSLDQRFWLAKNPARSVSFVHTYGFVHKNIGPDRNDCGVSKPFVGSWTFFSRPKYTNIVIFCLRCLDPEETNLLGTPAELQDQDGVVVGVRYIEKVISIAQSKGEVSLTNCRNR
jgi:hypothetical protein